MSDAFKQEIDNLTSKIEDRVAEEIFDYVCANRRDNKSKNPREVSCKYENLMDSAKEHYRCMARWHTAKFIEFRDKTLFK